MDSKVVQNILDDSDHPLQIALRTYALCLSSILIPVLLPAIFSLAVHPKSFTARARIYWRVLGKELRPTGFALAMTVAVGGGATLRRSWSSLERRPDHQWAWVRYINSKSSHSQKTFLANVISSTLAVTLLRWKRHRRLGTASATLDLSLLFLVRALDASVQACLLQKARKIAAQQVNVPLRFGVAFGTPVATPDSELPNKRSEEIAKEWQHKTAMHLDTFVFWASSARIMWCFFYQPQRLPLSLVKWISSLANVDERLLQALRGLREGTWLYSRGLSSERDIAGSLAVELGRPPSWADPAALPEYGANFANEAWKHLGVNGRNGVGGMPCELVHGGIGATFGLQNSCTANAAVRAVYAFAQVLVLHLPVHFLPILLSKPRSIAHPHRALSALISAIRSAAFLSTFVSSYWFMVCFTRTLVLARFFPRISHDVWDGPCGGTLAGSLVCGLSILIESARRREVALYVLPKALRAWISEKWLRSRNPMVQFVECLTFVLSLASLLTFSVHQPESLRGLSRWTLAFIMKGPNASFWKRRKKEIASRPPTPMDPSTPLLVDSSYHKN